jgi:hypothetical protein
MQSTAAAVCAPVSRANNHELRRVRAALTVCRRNKLACLVLPRLRRDKSVPGRCACCCNHSPLPTWSPRKPEGPQRNREGGVEQSCLDHSNHRKLPKKQPNHEAVATSATPFGPASKACKQTPGTGSPGATGSWPVPLASRNLRRGTVPPVLPSKAPMFHKRRAIPPKKNFAMPTSHGLPVGRKATVDKHIEYPKTRGLTVSFHVYLCSPRNDPKHQPKPVPLHAPRTPPINASRSEITTRLLQNPDPTRLLLRRTRALLDRSPKAIRFSRPHSLQHPRTRQFIHPVSTNPKERFFSIDKPSNVENPS